MPTFYLSENDLERLLTPHLNYPFVFLETTNFDKGNHTSFLFTDFTDIITFNYKDDINSFFRKIEYYLNKGYWLCGYFSYEFGYWLDEALYSLKDKSDYPLVLLGVCKRPLVIDHKRYKPNFNNLDSLKGDSLKIKNIKANINFKEYASQIEKIKHYLEEGQSYQVNFTFKIKFDFEGNILDFYTNLRRPQITSYSSLINNGNSFILSLSPELFFRKNEDLIITRPMKGTIKRGFYFEDDNKNRRYLKSSKKDKAENLMIVDLLRNDLGKISSKVWVDKIFEIEKYRTVYQMTSDIYSKLKKNVKIKEIFSSLFPCGSVTGAPKIKTMQIIKNLEKEKRGIYTGSIGYLSPQGDACFNVAIRTIVINNNKGELGVGGGIVCDSSAEGEYKEAMLKAEFFLDGLPKFSLLESILWQRDRGYYLLDLHLERLRKSAEYFSIPLDLERINRELKILAKNLKKGKFKIRIMVSIEGEIKIEKEPLQDITSPVKIKISECRANPRDIFLYHKTTSRLLYDKERKNAEREGFFEIIFLNSKEELTEGAITNIFVLKGETIYTPPVKCGLLSGVLREYLFKTGEAKEKILYVNDLLSADKIYIGNSVRGLLEVSKVEYST